VRIEGTPVCGGGKIFCKTEKGILYALGLSGQELWKVDSGKDPLTTALLYAEGTLVAGTSSGKLVAFDPETGKEKWAYEVGSSVQGTPNRIDLAGGGAGVIINSQGDGAIHGVDLATGRGLWKTDPVERCDGSAGVSKGRIAMGSCASALHLYTVGDSVTRTDVPLGGDCQVAGGVAISGNAAFAGTRSGKVCAVDLGQAKVLWVNEDNQREAFTTPAVNDRWVVFGSDDGKVYALGREKGQKIWEFDTGKKPSSPVLAGRRVAVSSGGTLFLLEAESGKKIWSAAVSDEITSPALLGGVLIVGADDGTVTAYGRK
jgi:outer membrane protein assembly factor BamB